MMWNATIGILLGGILTVGLSFDSPIESQTKPPEPATPNVTAGPRRPVAMVLADSGKWLFIANHRAGSISVIDSETRTVVNESPVGRTVSDLALTPDGSRLLALDEASGELVVYRRWGAKLESSARLAVGPNPVSLQIAADGSACYVASTWRRQVTIVEINSDGTPRTKKTIPMPFSPGRMVLLPAPEKLIVADAFGGRIAVIDPARGEAESVRSIPSHNFRGLALSGDGRRLLMSHQVLSSRSTTRTDDLHWGNLITNNVREISLDVLRNDKADLLFGSRLHHLGDVGKGAGDPAGVVVSPSGHMAVALSGVGEIAIRPRSEADWTRLSVGQRPSAVVLSPDGKWAFVANTFSDSISVVGLSKNQVAAEIPLGQKAELSAVDRGELLFHDSRLSLGGWFSCQSCHTDGHTNGLSADTFGDGTYGTPKRVPTLLGVKDTAPYGWTGRAKGLEDQIRSTMATTMRGIALTSKQEGDLIAYLNSLSPPPPLGQFGTVPENGNAKRGAQVFANRGCADCHESTLYTSSKTYDVSMRDEVGHRTFNPPSLRGISQASAYFHDGRANSITEVLSKQRHGLKEPLDPEELADLLTFLAKL